MIWAPSALTFAHKELFPKSLVNDTTMWGWEVSSEKSIPDSITLAWGGRIGSGQDS